MTVDLPPARYRTAAEMREFDARVLANLGAIPGVDAVGAINWRTAWRRAASRAVSSSRMDANFREAYHVDTISVTPGYFRSMGIRIERGRDFTADDRAGAPRVVILSRSVADEVLAGRAPDRQTNYDRQTIRRPPIGSRSSAS